jgi:hypothetical protein
MRDLQFDDVEEHFLEDLIKDFVVDGIFFRIIGRF